MKALIIFLTIGIIIVACKSKEKYSSIEMITSESKQDSIFRALLTVTDNSIPDELLNDSLAFLVLPVQASCPSCRKKTVDSILKYRDRLASNHFIIISAKGGHKTINSYFREEDSELPVIPGRLLLDSTDQAAKLKLYDEKPTMYYAHGKKVYKKVGAVPSTVRQDLQEFFSGYRNEETD